MVGVGTSIPYCSSTHRYQWSKEEGNVRARPDTPKPVTYQPAEPVVTKELTWEEIEQQKRIQEEQEYQRERRKLIAEYDKERREREKMR
jgi:hypothetical protein